MKAKLASAMVALVVSQGALAFGVPQACPAVDQLQAVGVSMVMQDPDQPGMWAGVNMSNAFGTSDNWSFFAGPVQSQSQTDAVSQINQKIPGLALMSGPEQMEQGRNQYACFYATQSYDFFGVTVTPAFEMKKVFGLLNKLKR